MGVNKGVHTFPKGICPKVNIIAWLALELPNYIVVVQYTHHYAMENTEFKTVVMLLKIDLVSVWLWWRGWINSNSSSVN